VRFGGKCCILEGILNTFNAGIMHVKSQRTNE
jgi:hypothetical protein